MALPAVQAIEQCSDFSMTVEPYLPQLYQLPGKIVENIASPQGLLKVYAETNPLIFGFAVSVFLAAVFLVVSEINKNYSQVDRLWSILPNLYVAHLAGWARLVDAPHARVDLIVVATTIWSIRLTYNYWRRGGYEIGSEDYRWAIVQKNVPAWAFFTLNVVFISSIQSVLLFAFSAVPAYSILLASQFEKSITAADFAYFSIIVGLVVSEWISDGQQYEFQTAKHQYQKDAKLPHGFHQADLDRGFITSGIWGYIRHPNFAAEQVIWFFLYQWGCFATNTLYSWTFAGSAFLILLFQGSTWLTELITAGKYPEYLEYQKQVGMFMPTSFYAYKTPVHQPKIIRTSELAKRQKQKQK